MLKRLYEWVVRLHPPGFRDRFGAEMLSIFDEAAAPRAKSAVVADGIASIFRQWIFRPEYAGEGVAEFVQCSSSGTPVFFTLDEYRPRTSALVWGGVVTLGLFCAAWLLAEYTWTHPVFMPLTTVQFEAPPEPAQEGHSAMSPLPLGTIPSSDSSADPSSGRAQMPRDIGSAAISTSAERAASSSQNDSNLRLRRPVAAREADGARVAPVLRQQPATNAEGVAARGGAANISTPPIPEDTALSYAGVYVVEGIEKSRIIVTAENGRLAIELDGEPKTALVPVGAAKFIFANSKSSWIKFVKDASGSVGEIEISRNGRYSRALRKGN